MANWMGQVSRVGIAIQTIRRGVEWPNWAGSFGSINYSRPNGWLSDLANVAIGRRDNFWATQLPGGYEVKSTFYCNTFGRYPKSRRHDIYTYGIRHDAEFSVTGAYIAVDIHPVNLASHAGINAGASSGKAWLSATTVDVHNRANVQNWGQLFGNLNGWNISIRQHRVWATYNNSTGIKYCTAHLQVDNGDESFHDAGDRSPRDWNSNSYCGVVNTGVAHNMNDQYNHNADRDDVVFHDKYYRIAATVPNTGPIPRSHYRQVNRSSSGARAYSGSSDIPTGGYTSPDDGGYRSNRAIPRALQAAGDLHTGDLWDDIWNDHK